MVPNLLELEQRPARAAINADTARIYTFTDPREMNILKEKFKEMFMSMLPIMGIVILLHLTLAPLKPDTVGGFLFGSLLMFIGIPVFLVGIDLSIEEMGTSMSQALVLTNKASVVLIGAFIFGFLVTAAEPDMHILARQVSDVTAGRIGQWLLVLTVATGLGIFTALGLWRLLRRVRFNFFMFLVYLLILFLGIFVTPDILAIGFDAYGSTTGSVTVPFLLALAAGVAGITHGKQKESADAFGLLGVASAGGVIGVLALGLLSGGNGEASTVTAQVVEHVGWFARFIDILPSVLFDIFASLTPVVLIFLVMNRKMIRMPKPKMRRVTIGLIYTFIGFILFLTGVNGGFITAAFELGYNLAALEIPWLLVVLGVILGMATIPAEPSVHILTRQIEEVTARSIKSKAVMIALSIGVGLAIGLSIFRILIPALQLWHLLLPILVISISLSFFVPDIFVGIGYDSGGVAAGTMVATFMLPIARGIADYVPTANIMRDAFGVIALAAVAPLLTIQLLGLFFKIRATNIQEEEPDEELSF